jgi:hypothetical protein
MTEPTPCSAMTFFHQAAICHIALHEESILAHLRLHAGRKIVQHKDAVTAIQQRIDGMAADITGAARHQDQFAHGAPITRKT